MVAQSNNTNLSGDTQAEMPAGQGFLNYFLTSFRVTILVIVGISLLGVGTVLSLPRESTPEIKVPFAAVVTVFPGASARDIEELVTTPIEDELLNLDGLKEITSSSRSGVSSVNLEFNAEEDLDDALRRLREAVDGITDLPEDAEEPEVIEVDFSDTPILSISLGGIDDERLLSVLAERLADRLEEIQGVSQVDVIGARDEEIRIVFDPNQLSRYGVSVLQVLGSIRSANIDAPLGQLETDRYAYDLRVVGGFNHVGDVAGIPIALPNGQVVPLSVLADVELALSDRSSLSRVAIGDQDSTPAVTLSVRKKTGGSIIDIIDEVKRVISAVTIGTEDDALSSEERAGAFLPAEIQVVTFADNADEIRESLSNVTRSGIQTLVIVFLLLWVFLGWRAAIISALAVPMTFFLSFIIFSQTGTTLNNVSLFSLILSLGLLVDTTIVIVEGVYSKREEGDDLTLHAAKIVKRFKKAVVGGTLTTVAAFFPMLLSTGIIGEFLKVIPIVVTATLLSSLFVALAFIPVVTVKLMGLFGGEASLARERTFDRLFNRFRVRYDAFIASALERKGFQRLFYLVLVLLLMAGFALPFAGVLQTGLFPAADIDFVIVNVELPPGSLLSQTDGVMKRVEGSLRGIPDVTSYVANVGSSTSLDIGGGGSSSENLGSFFINLDKERERSSLEVAAEMRELVKPITGAKVVVEEVSSGPPTAAPVALQVIGDDLQVLDEVSQEIMDEMAVLHELSDEKNSYELIDIDRNLRTSAGEFRFIFDREALRRYGLTITDAAGLLRTTVFGLEVTTFLDEAGDEVSVRLESTEEATNSVDDVLALPVLTPTGDQITVGQIAQVELGSAIDALRHVDGERAVSVTANVGADVNANAASAKLNEVLSKKTLPDGVRYEFGGEQQDTEETFNQLYRSMIIAVILILLILVVEFNSYLQPFIIFVSVPLALIGVLFGLAITGGQLNFAAFIGLVSLTGIVVNNAIILVDRMNASRAAGADVLSAVKEASSSRLRPIVLTTITTAAGVAPLIWVDAFFRDMALTLITGLLFSSVLTLIFIPIRYYNQAIKIERRLARKVGRKSEEPSIADAYSPVP